MYETQTQLPSRTDSALHSLSCTDIYIPSNASSYGCPQRVSSPPAYAYSAARHHCAYEYISTGNLKTWPMVISRHTDRTGTWRLRDIMNTRLKPFIFILAYLTL
jgi:hypothetical protein